MNKKFFLGLIKEGIGYESGFFRTLFDLLKDPKMVVEASAKNDLTYVNPVKFMMTICSYFVVVNGFFIDWERVSIQHVTRINFLISGENKIENAEIIYAQLIDFLFSTGFVPLLIITAIVQLYFISKQTQRTTYSFDYQKDALFYYHGLNVLLYFVFSLSAAFLTTNIFLIMYGVYLFLVIIRFRKVIELKPIHMYFQHEKDEISKLFKKTMNKAYLVLIFSSTILFTLIEYIDNKFLGNIFF